jgi:predicted ATPase
MARLDRLGAAKRVAQLGATLGREFPYSLLQAISPVNEATLRKALTRLVEAELLYQQGLPPHTMYIFKHALIQDAAYQSLLKSKRRQLHQQVGQVLEEQFAETVETQPELLAHHYTEAGLIEQAIPYWRQAGQKALERSANVEAIRHITKGLSLLSALPDASKRAQQELTLQIALGVSLMAIKGYAAPEAKQAYDRARELCRQVGETPQLIPVLRGVAAFYFVRAELHTARELGEQLFHIAQYQPDPALLVEAHQELGGTLANIGELRPALEHIEQGIALYNLQRHRPHVFLYGQDPGVSCLSRASQILFLLGYPDQALKRIREALTLAEKLAHPHSQAYALSFASMLALQRGERQLAQEQAKQIVSVATEQSLPFWLAMGTILHGQALVFQGNVQEGIQHLRNGMDAYRATGAAIGWPYTLARLGFAQASVGHVEMGLSLLNEAIALVQKTGEGMGEPTLYVLKGELLLKQPTEDHQLKLRRHREAEECFVHAIAVARRQQAKGAELQAVLSLSRLWHQQGKTEDARRELVAIYGWFTEGFDTIDLRAARKLLARMSS